MSDENGEGLFNPQGNADQNGNGSVAPETPSQQPEGNGEENQPKFVTEDILNQKLEELSRKVQSSRDSALSTFDKRIKQRVEQVEKDIEAWRKAGVNITPEQEQQRRLEAMQQAMLDNSDADSPSGQREPASSQQPQEDIVREVNAWAAQKVQQAGITLEQSDPEIVLLDQSSPEAFKQSFTQALYQKRVRTGETQGPPAQARIPSMAQGSTKPPTKAEQKFLEEYKAAKGKGTGYAREIRDKYRQAGVDVDSLASQIL